MHRIDGPGATVDNTFTEGDPVGGVQATVVGAAWLNDIQEELMSVLAGAGIEPVKGVRDQVLKSIRTISLTPTVKRFTNSGSFTVPEGVTTIYVSGCAGGGGGSGGSGNYIQGAAAPAGGGGGAGKAEIGLPLNVVPGQVLSIRIGTGGRGGERGVPGGTGPGDGTAGGDTVIGSLLTLKGGEGGLRGHSPSGGAYAGGEGGAGFPNGGSGTDGGSTIDTPGHSGVSGAGASGPYGGGGPSQRSGIPTPDVTDGVFDGISAAGFGAGGGGGGSSYINIGPGGKGGDGAPGFLLIRW